MYEQLGGTGGKTERLAGAGGLLRAAELLRGGGTVAFPTETVYGLGANALDATAVAKIFVAKQRPGWDPLIVHVCDREMMHLVADVTPALNKDVEALIGTFWPGPLTLLLPRTAAVPDAVTAGRPLVGVRMPGHPVALELIRRAGIPIAAPSANRFGHTSPTAAAHVLEDLDGRIDAVLDDGPTAVGVESTVIGPSRSGSGWTLYRPGGVTVEMLETVCGPVEIFRPTLAEGVTPESLPSPGVGIRHYAPRAKLILVADKSDLADSIREKTGVMLPDGWNADNATAIYPWGPWDDGAILAQRLFAGLRELDETGVDFILCPVPQIGGLGAAMRDRLEKAARIK